MSVTGDSDSSSRAQGDSPYQVVLISQEEVQGPVFLRIKEEIAKTLGVRSDTFEMHVQPLDFERHKSIIHLEFDLKNRSQLQKMLSHAFQEENGETERYLYMMYWDGQCDSAFFPKMKRDLLKHTPTYQAGHSSVRKICRIILVIVLFLLVLVGSCVNQASTGYLLGPEKAPKETTHAALFLVTFVPWLASAIVCFLLFLTRELGKAAAAEVRLKTEKQVVRAVLVTIVIAFSESAGTIILSTFIFPYMTPLEYTLVLNGVSFVPLVVFVVYAFRRGTGRDIIRSILSILFEIGGIGLFTYSYIYEPPIQFNLLLLPVSLVLVSVSWWTSLIQWRMGIRDAQRWYRFGLTALRYFVNCVILLLGTLIYLQLADVHDKHNAAVFFDSVYSVITGVNETDTQITYLQIGSAAAAYFGAGIAGTMSHHKIALALPVLLTTPAMVATPYVWCKLQQHHCWWDPELFYTKNMFVWAGGALFWLVSLVTSSIFASDKEIPTSSTLKSEDQIWLCPGYRPLFATRDLGLNHLRYPRPMEGMPVDQRRHATVISTTFYHDSESEMVRNINAISSFSREVIVKEQEMYEFHILFDDAIDPTTGGPNSYVQQLFRVFSENDVPIRTLRTPEITDYGLCYSTELFNPVAGVRFPFYIHLKNRKLVQLGRRQSQCLWIRILLQRIGEDESLRKYFPDDLFLLMVDGRTRFEKRAVDQLRFEMYRSRQVGMACGRIIPDAEEFSLVALFQKFELAISHWLQRPAEDIFGSVLYCPAGFSMIRFSALLREAHVPIIKYQNHYSSAAETYTKRYENALEYLLFHADERLLTTMILANGWNTVYSATALCYFRCPSSFKELCYYYRYWIPGTYFNTIYILNNWRRIVGVNRTISSVYLIYVLFTVACSILTPAAILVFIYSCWELVFPEFGWVGGIIAFAVPGSYCLFCLLLRATIDDSPEWKAWKMNQQIHFAFIIWVFYAVSQIVLLVGIVAYLVQYDVSATLVFIASLASIFVLSAILHGFELFTLACGVIYVLFMPTMHVILLLFAFANIRTLDDPSVARERVGWIQLVKKIWRSLAESARADPNSKIPPTPLDYPDPKTLLSPRDTEDDPETEPKTDQSSAKTNLVEIQSTTPTGPPEKPLVPPLVLPNTSVSTSTGTSTSTSTTSQETAAPPQKTLTGLAKVLDLYNCCVAEPLTSKGDSFVESLAIGLFNDASHANEIRQLICQWHKANQNFVLANGVIFNTVCDSSHVAAFRNPGEYAQECDVFAASQALQATVYVFSTLPGADAKLISYELPSSTRTLLLANEEPGKYVPVKIRSELGLPGLPPPSYTALHDHVVATQVRILSPASSQKGKKSRVALEPTVELFAVDMNHLANISRRIWNSISIGRQTSVENKKEAASKCRLTEELSDYSRGAFAFAMGFTLVWVLVVMVAKILFDNAQADLSSMSALNVTNCDPVTGEDCTYLDPNLVTIIFVTVVASVLVLQLFAEIIHRALVFMKSLVIVKLPSCGVACDTRVNPNTRSDQYEPVQVEIDTELPLQSRV